MAWNKNGVQAGYAFFNASDPVMPTASNHAWTLEAWLRPDVTVSDWSPLIGQQAAVTTPTSRQNIWLRSGEIYLIGPSSDVPTGIYLPESRWTHLAWVMSTSTSSQLYVDGSLAWSGTITRGTGGPFFTVGGSRQEGYATFDGQIDQVKVWGTNLSAAHVSESMHTYGSAFSGAPAASCTLGLRAHYDFNEFVTGSVIDRSGCAKNLAFNTAVSGSYAASDLTSTGIISFLYCIKKSISALLPLDQ
jgi:hypothetical protein